jgi:hypothetical protein
LAFGVGITLDFILVAIARTRRIETIGLVYKAVATSARVMGPLFAIAILLGFYIAHVRHEPLLATWLLVTYALVLIGIAFNAGVLQRRTQRVLAAVRDANGSWTPELEDAAANARPLGAWVLLILMAAVIALMVMKPA